MTAISPVKRHIRKAIIAALVLLTAGVSFPASAAEAATPASRPVLTIGIAETPDSLKTPDPYQLTVQYLKEKLPQYEIRTVPLDFSHLTDEVKAKRPDFMMSSAGTYIIHAWTTGAHRIVQMKGEDAADIHHAVASTIIVPAGRSELTDLASLKGRRAAASDPHSFDGWLIALGAIASKGYDPDKFFSLTFFTENRAPSLADLLREGKVDVGVLPSCDLEALIARGDVKPGEFRVINEQKSAPGRCARSTAQYSGNVFSSLPWTPPGEVKPVVMALLEMPRDLGGVEWDLSQDMTPVIQLVKDLKLGAYSYLREQGIGAVLYRYRNYLFIALALILALVLHTFYVKYLVSVRTRELREALDEKERLHAETLQQREKVQNLEKAGIISFMSGLFAHEIKQPIQSLVFNAASLKLLMDSKVKNEAKEREIVDKIVSQTKRANAIVGQVNRYSSRTATERVPLDIMETIEQAIEKLPRSSRDGVTVRKHYAVNRAMVLGVPIEVEFILLNLLRNAFYAAKKSAQPEVSLSIEDRGPAWGISVADNGPAVSDAVFESVGTFTRSEKEGGLGIGLALARSIAERHEAHIEFTRAEPSGLAACLVFPKAKEEAS